MYEHLSRLKTKKFLIIIPLVVFFLIIRTILLQNSNKELLYTVKKEDLVDIVQVSGNYSASSQAQVVSPTNGVIDEIFVKNEDLVKKGDKLFHVQSSATLSKQKEAYAKYLAASSTVAADKADLYSLQSKMYSTWKKFTDISTNSTFENDDGTPKADNRTLTEFTTVEDDWLAAEANYKNQQKVLAKDQAALSAAELSYNETQSVTVVSPADGIIANLLAEAGDQVDANMSGVLVVTSLSKPHLTADISEDYAARVEKGQKVTIVFDGLKSKTFSGRVENINSVGTKSQGIVTYTARITPFDIPSIIKQNMTALMTIETLRKNNVIDVPNSAIIVKEGKTYVKSSGIKRLIEVQTGTRGTTKTEITKGLTEGTTILANP